MEISVLRVILIKPCHDRGTVDFIGADRCIPLCFKRPLIVQDQRGHKRPAALAHDDESIIILINVPDVILAEVSTVEDEADLLIVILNDLIDHEGELGHVGDRTGVFLVKEGDAVRLVHRNRKVEYGEAFVVLSFPILDDIDIPGVTVLVGRVIRDVDPAPVVTVLVPIIQEAYALVLADRVQEPAPFGITVDRHFLRKEGVGEGKVRIILACVFLFNDQVRYEVKDEPCVIAEQLFKHLLQPVFIEYFPDDDACADLETAAPVSKWEFVGELDIREIDLELFIWNHQGWIVLGFLPHYDPQWDSVFSFTFVLAAILILHIGGPALFLEDDLPFDFRDFLIR